MEGAGESRVHFMLTRFVLLLVLFDLRGKVEDRRIDTEQNIVKVLVTSDTLIPIILIHQCVVGESLCKVIGGAEDFVATIQSVLNNLRLALASRYKVRHTRRHITLIPNEITIQAVDAAASLNITIQYALGTDLLEAYRVLWDQKRRLS